MGGTLAWGFGAFLALAALVIRNHDGQPIQFPFALFAGAAFVRAAIVAGSWRKVVEGNLALQRLREADEERLLNAEHFDLSAARRRIATIEETTRRFEAETEIVRTIEGSLETAAIARATARRARETIGRGRVIVYRRIAGETDETVPIATSPAADPEALDGTDYNPIALETRTNLLVVDVGREYRVRPRSPSARSFAAVAVVPLIAGHEIWGCLRLECDEAGAIDREDLHLLSAIAVPATLALQNADLFAQADALARIDGLTGVLRRHVFDKALDDEARRSARYKRPLSLLLFDVDHFKGVNDEFGHPAGDAVLRAVGRALAAGVERPGSVARYGGEEFAVLLPETPLDRAVAIADSLRRAVAGIRVEEIPRPVTISAGAAAFPSCAAGGAALLEAADRALYRAKEAGRNRVEAAPPVSAPTGGPEGGARRKKGGAS